MTFPYSPLATLFIRRRQGETSRMRLLRIGPHGAERPAVLDDRGRCLDLSGLTRDIDGAFLASGGISGVREALTAGSLSEVDISKPRIGVPVARPGKVVCIGLN